MATISPSQPDQSERVGGRPLAAAQCKQQLLDTTRSPLLYYRDLKTGTLELTPRDVGGQVNPSAVDSLLACRKVRLSKLIPEASVNGSCSLADTRNRVKRNGQLAQACLERKGVSMLFLAGSWPRGAWQAHG